MIEIKQSELYQEFDIYADDKKIGECEVEINSKMISRLFIYPPYQNRHYGTEVVAMLNEKYGCNNLWVKADNSSAIRIYEKNGYKISKPTMFEMTREAEAK